MPLSPSFVHDNLCLLFWFSIFSFVKAKTKYPERHGPWLTSGTLLLSVHVPCVGDGRCSPASAVQLHFEEAEIWFSSEFFLHSLESSRKK